MPIHTKVDSARQLTIHTANGEVSFDEIIAALKLYYSKNPTLNVLWDFSEGSGMRVSVEQIEKIADFASKEIPKARIGGKSAAVTPGDLEYGLGRMVSSFFEINRYKAEHQIFRRLEDAISWIFEKNNKAQ